MTIDETCRYHMICSGREIGEKVQEIPSGKPHDFRRVEVDEVDDTRHSKKSPPTLSTTVD